MNDRGVKAFGFISLIMNYLKNLLLFTCLLSGLVQFSVADNTAPATQPVVVMKTSMGQFKLELYPDKAPITVQNFLTYVDEGFYNETLFHRVIQYFMIQGGGMDTELNMKPNHEPIISEADNGLNNERGTVAMARTRDVNSAKSQFFINLEDNKHLDYTKRNGGYTVFGRVIEGMEVVDEISNVETKNVDRYYDLPAEPVILHSVTRDKEKSKQ